MNFPIFAVPFPKVTNKKMNRALKMGIIRSNKSGKVFIVMIK